MKYNKNDILGFETDTVWGIGCHPLDENSVNKIYELKGRDRTKPLILMSDDIQKLYPYIKNVPDYAKNFIDKFFPGGLTLIFEKTEICPLFITSNKNTVGIRIPNHNGFLDIAKNFEGGVLATTSLNLSNKEPVKNYDEAIKQFGDKIKIIKPIDNIPPKGTASTVVLCTGEKPIVLRQGEIII